MTHKPICSFALIIILYSLLSLEKQNNFYLTLHMCIKICIFLVKHGPLMIKLHMPDIEIAEMGQLVYYEQGKTYKN